MRPALALPSLLLALAAPACLTRRAVEVRSGPRVVKTLPATLTRSQGLWTLDVELPRGPWSARFPGESGSPRVVQQEGPSHARIELEDARIRQDRPIILELAAPDGQGPTLTYSLRIKIPGEGVLNFFHFLSQGHMTWRQ